MLFFGVLFFSPRFPLAVCDGALWSTTRNLLHILPWWIQSSCLPSVDYHAIRFFHESSLCVCGSKIDRLEMISSPWWSVNFRVPRFETRPCVKNPWWTKTGWMRNPRPETWNSSQFWQKHQLIKSEFLNHQHWNRKIWFLFIGIVVVIIWIYPQPRMPVTFSSIMNHFSGSGIPILNLHLWLAS